MLGYMGSQPAMQLATQLWFKCCTAQYASAQWMQHHRSCKEVPCKAGAPTAHTVFAHAPCCLQVLGEGGAKPLWTSAAMALPLEQVFLALWGCE